MPCDSSHLRATDREVHSRQVRELLREINGEPFNHKNPKDYYGCVAELDRDVRALCEWCKTHTVEITTQSLELQMWWRDHQEADKIRENKEARDREKAHLQSQGLSKLTPEERKALGI